MPKRIKTERRRYPRISQQVSLQIAANGYDFTTKTQNISCIGAYCHLDKYIPPFTKIGIRLTLPLITHKRQSDSNVECMGVVVRTEDDTNGGFNIALFFNEIKERQRKKISQYIHQFLPKSYSSLKR